MGDDVILVDHESRHRAALNDLVQGALAFDHLFFDFKITLIAVFDHLCQPVGEFLEVRQDIWGGARLLFQLRQRLAFLAFKLQQTRDGPGLDVIDEFDALGFAFSDDIIQGRIVGHFNQHLEVLEIVEFPVVLGRKDSQLSGKEKPLGLRVDVGNPENGGAAVSGILFIQELEKDFTETPAPNQRDIGIQ